MLVYKKIFKPVYFRYQMDFIEILAVSGVDVSYELRKLDVLSVIYSFPGNLKIAACVSQMYDNGTECSQNTLKCESYIFLLYFHNGK